jgi:hypothetical protein
MKKPYESLNLSLVAVQEEDVLTTSPGFLDKDEHENSEQWWLE